MSDQALKGRFDELTAERDGLKAENMKLRERLEITADAMAEIADFPDVVRHLAYASVAYDISECLIPTPPRRQTETPNEDA